MNRHVKPYIDYVLIYHDITDLLKPKASTGNNRNRRTSTDRAADPAGS